MTLKLATKTLQIPHIVELLCHYAVHGSTIYVLEEFNMLNSCPQMMPNSTVL